uniref:Uncharacterized protein n=1 Tax=Picea sitchensis TaxID=3332 RepID=A0A6B9XVN0_PICSI|nr:hypothetical protein Q903MT_gene3749 [Picea sitchensis]
MQATTPTLFQVPATRREGSPPYGREYVILLLHIQRFRRRIRNVESLEGIGGTNLSFHLFNLTHYPKDLFRFIGSRNPAPND